MEPERRQYKGHRIELRAREGEEAGAREEARGEGLDLLIDDEPVPYGRLPDGLYFLQEYAYDWTDDLMDLATRFIDHRERADDIQRQAEAP
ncbi:MAG: twin-arginine translocation pathway signal protein [Actinomycetota bacterium]|nr:twin-arginine translocation pathway signal protein [Actinomycetota bacterium]